MLTKNNVFKKYYFHKILLLKYKGVQKTIRGDLN